MKTDCCHSPKPIHDASHQPASRWRRGGEVAGLILPTTLLVLMPKCPVCLAAYVALAAGIGISLPAAAVLRTSLLLVCVSALTLVAVVWLRRALLQRRGK